MKKIPGKEKLKKKFKVNTIVICVLVVLLLISVIVLIVNVKSTGVTEENNLSNMGLVTSGDDYVFYYKQSTGIVKIKDDEEYEISTDQAYSLNYADGYLYYTTPNNSGGIDIKKISHNGDSVQTLVSVSSSSTKMYLVDGYLYYLTSNPNTISKIDINGENETILKVREMSDFEVKDDMIYGVDSFGVIYTMDLDGENFTEIYEAEEITKIQIYDGNLYYYEEEVGLNKLDLNSLEVELVSSDVNSGTFNVTNKGIFYLDSENLKICKISLNGGSVKELVSVNTLNTKINISGDILYYLKAEDETSSYETCQITINGKDVD